MIINSDLMYFYENHPVKKLNPGEILGSFFVRNDDDTLPEGLYEISDSHDFATGTIEDGYEWVFDSDLLEPVATEKEDTELTAQQQINALESTQTARRLREAALYASDQETYADYSESYDFIADIDTQIITLRAEL